MIKCSKCNIEKPDENFCFKNKQLGIRHSVCKECQKEYKLKYYHENKQSHYERNRKTEKKVVDYIDEYKSTHSCIACGESSPECLDFHHLRDKDIEICKLRRYGSINRVKMEIEKCVMLCANCHRKVHAGTLDLESIGVV